MPAERPDVVTRIAPSPTGEPHVGTAYVGLFNWAWARRNGGRFILRIEDTDQSRSRQEHEDEIIAALAWLGIDADESPAVGGPCAPYRQSERSASYLEHVQLLIDKGAAYRCFCTAERLDELRAFQKAAKRPTGYDGQCRSIHADESAERAKGEPFVVRMAVDRAGETRWTDLLRGEIVISNEQVDDQVLLKSDGLPANPMVKGIAMVTTRRGPRAVSFIAQGKNGRSLKEAPEASGNNLRLKMRWTGRDAVTITGVAEEKPADIAA